MSAPEDNNSSRPTPLSDRVRLIAAGLIEDCRLAADYEAKLLDVADEIAVFERRGIQGSNS